MKLKRRQPSKGSHLPIVLTIAGSDSGGGAGIQADLRTFAALGVHGVTAITCITAQNPKRVTSVMPVSAKMIVAQLDALAGELRPTAAKSGMLYSESIVRVVADYWAQMRGIPLIVDPVMVATSGSTLLSVPAVNAIRNHLLPKATLVTPNLDEAELLSGMILRTVEDLRKAARWLYAEFGCAVLAKGGHLKAMSEAIDIFFDGQEELLLSAPFVRGVATHGTGCTYSAAIAANLALGMKLNAAVVKAKSTITKAILNSRGAGHHSVLWPT